VSGVRFTSYMSSVEGKIKRAQRRALTRAGMQVVKDAKANATSDPKVRTGRGRSSITYEIIGEDRVRIGTNVFYMAYLEFGTRFTYARQWLRKAVLDNINTARDFFAEEFGRM